MRSDIIKDKKGQALIEAVAAIGILLVGVFGAVAFLINSLSLNQTVTNQYIASYMAAEQIEVAKNIVDVNGVANVLSETNSNEYYSLDFDDDSFRKISNSDNYMAVKINNDGFYISGEGVTGETTEFKKRLRIEEIGGSNDKMRVVSAVKWEENGQNYEVVLEDHFYEWRGGE